MMFKLALVTGATSGIGEATARLLAEKGISLILTGRNQEKLSSLKQELKVPVQTLSLDLARDRSLLIHLIREQSPDLIINNAGFGLYGNAVQHPTKDLLEIVEVNDQALLEITLEGAKALITRKQPGVILNISSVAAFLPMPRTAVYAASKAFVNSLSEAFDEELAPQGIRVLALCPGVVDTSFSQTASRRVGKTPTSQTPMTSTYVAQKLWEQIEKGQRVKIVDWKYWLITQLTKLVPNSFITKFSKNWIKES